MVKTKRLLVALVAILALTVPRFLFITVAEEEAVYFDEESLPDGSGELENWRPVKILVCDECVNALDEKIRTKTLSKVEEVQIFYSPYHPNVDNRCPVHPEVSVHVPVHFDWGNTSGGNSNLEKTTVPENLLEFYPREIVLYPEKVRGIFICPECQRVISERLASDKIDIDYEGNRQEELRALREKITRNEPIEGSGSKLMYFAEDILESYCTLHPGSKMRETVRIPVHPVVKQNLPEDTEYITRKFVSRESLLVDLTIVTSGKDKRSIHRPERCIPAQGYSIRDRQAITIKLPEGKRKRINVMMLRLVNTVIEPETKKRSYNKMIVFYWYASVEHITESNLRRLLYTAWDRMILGKNYHWSYVLLTTHVIGDTSRSRTELEDKGVESLYSFMQQFFPKVER